MSKNATKNTFNNADRFNSILKASKNLIRSPRGQVTVLVAALAMGGGILELSNSINVRYDKAEKEIKQRNSKNFYKYKMLENPASLVAHGACSQELAAESKYYSAAARIVGPDRGISENGVPLDYKYLTDNAKIYKQSAKLAMANEVSCYAANSKMTSLTPHFDTQIMTSKKQCADYLEQTPVIDVNSEPTQFGRDMAAAKNMQREIAIKFAETQKISC